MSYRLIECGRVKGKIERLNEASSISGLFCHFVQKLLRIGGGAFCYSCAWNWIFFLKVWSSYHTNYLSIDTDNVQGPLPSCSRPSVLICMFVWFFFFFCQTFLAAFSHSSPSLLVPPRCCTPFMRAYLRVQR